MQTCLHSVLLVYDFASTRHHALYELLILTIGEICIEDNVNLRE